MKQVYSWPTASRTLAAMTLAWGAKVRGRWRHPGPIFFRPLRVKGIFCALTGRAAFLFRRNPVECAIVCIKTCSYVCIDLCKHSNMEKYKHASRCDPVLYLSLQPHEGCSITCIAQFIAVCSWLKVVVWSKYANRLSPGCVIRNLRIFYILGRLIRSNSNR
jgi:hypothetical protein